MFRLNVFKNKHYIYTHINTYINIFVYVYYTYIYILYINYICDGIMSFGLFMSLGSCAQHRSVAMRCDARLGSSGSRHVYAFRLPVSPTQKVETLN